VWRRRFTQEKNIQIVFFFFNIILWKKVQIIKINGFNFLCVMQKLLLSLSILSQNFESVKSSEGFIYLVIQFYFPVHRSKTFSHRSGEARADNEDFPPTRRTFPREIWLMSLTLIDIARYKSLIEQRCSCTIRYFDRPDSFFDLVTWPTTIYDH
jgi:hypothetical protein